jgi:tetrahydromethanopterin S-methyltransferase subunit G
MGGFGAAVAGLRDDIVFAARVDDHTKPFFDNFDKRLDDLARKLDTTSKKTSKGAKESAASIGVLAGAIAGVTSKLISMGMQAAASMQRLVKSSIQLSARADTLKVALNKVGATAGMSSDQMDKLEEDMKNTGITTIKSREALMKMVQANLDLSKATDLARVAQNAAVIAGTNSSEAFSRMLHGITTLQPEVLRGLGIIVNMQNEIKAYADANNVAANSIDANTKQQIALNAVLKQGERIAGSYEAAMDTAGKQAGSMSRHLEELQLAIGNAFQPAYSELIQFQTRELKELRTWFEENKEVVKDFSDILGFLAKMFLNTASAVIGLAKELPNLIRHTVPLFAILELLPDIDNRWQELGRTFKIVLAAMVTGFTFFKETLSETADHIKNLGSLIQEFMKLMLTPFWERGPDWDAAFAGLEEKMAAIKDNAAGAMDRITESSREAGVQAAKDLGLIEETADAAAPALDNVADSMDAVATETEEAVAKIKDLNEKMAEEMAEIEKQRARDAIRDAIAEARQREDLARNHKKRIDKIHKDAAKRRAELTKDLADEEKQLIQDQAKEREELEKDSAENLLDIETDYRKRLQDIQRAFERDVAEAARNNDAVAVARLIRQNKVNLEEAKIGRDRRTDEEKTDRDKAKKQLEIDQADERKILKADAEERRADLAEDLAERLRMADEQRTEDIASLERSLQRKKEDQMLQRKWEEEDRAEKWEEELTGLADHFAELQHIDELGLKHLLDTHGEFIKDDLTLWDRYYNRRTTAAAQTRYGSAIEESRAYSEEAENLGFGGSTETSSGGEGDDVGFARGGFGVFNTPRRVNVAEEVPELVAAIPLNAVVNHNINMAGRIDVNGNGNVPSGSEGEIGTAVFNLLAQFGQQLLARSS